MTQNNAYQINFRKATLSDLTHMVRLLADDTIGEKREQYSESLPNSYYAAFESIDADPNNWLIVAELNDRIIGTLQLTFITYLTYQGGKRAQIEGVRVDKSVRHQGIGKAMLEWAIQIAKEQGCHVVQLTADKRRADALKFYASLGFAATHEGLKVSI